MIIADGNTSCSNCHQTPMKGQPMLEGEGGSLLCSPDCWEEDELAHEFKADDPDPGEEDEDEY